MLSPGGLAVRRILRMAAKSSHLLKPAMPSELASASAASSSTSASLAAAGPVQAGIEVKITNAFAPSFLEVRNESFMHNVPEGSETHFKITVVSNAFEGKRLLQRHRAVNELLAEELDGPVHALSLVTKTDAQWAKSSAVAPSPGCRGGDGSLPPRR